MSNESDKELYAAFEHGSESRESEIESLRQQLADSQKQEPVAIYNGREREYGYETITIFSDFKEGTELFTRAGAMTKRDQACIDACANIPTYQLTGEDYKPTDLYATIESLRQQLAERYKQVVMLRDALRFYKSALTADDVAGVALAIQPDDSALKAWLGEQSSRVKG